MTRLKGDGAGAIDVVQVVQVTRVVLIKRQLGDRNHREVAKTAMADDRRTLVAPLIFFSTI